jgi:hypothetical protein
MVMIDSIDDGGGGGGGDDDDESIQFNRTQADTQKEKKE